MADGVSHDEAAMRGALPGERPGTALAKQEPTPWYVVVSDDHVYSLPEEKRPGKSVRYRGSSMETGWPPLAAGQTPTKAFMHPSFNYPRWPFSIYKVDPMDRKLQLDRNSSGGDAWMRSAKWQVLDTVPEASAFGPNGNHVIDLFENLSQTHPTLSEEEALGLLNTMQGKLMRAGSLYEGSLRTRIEGLYKDLSKLAKDRDLREELLAAEGVAAHFAGTFGYAETPILFDLAAAWAVVLGDTVANPVAELPALVAGGVVPRSTKPNNLVFNWAREKPQEKQTETAGIATVLSKGNDLSDEDMAWLERIEERMSTRLVGHEANIHAFAERVRSKALGLIDPEVPVSAVALGPSGNGKTEFFRTVAQAVYGSDEKMEVLDMSDFMDKSDAARLAGAPPRYIGYDDGSPLLNAVKPFSTFDEKTKTWSVNGVLLFDELDKAHPDIYNILLGINSKGTYKLADGQTLDFRNAVVGMTGNFGTSDMKLQSGVGFSARTVGVPSRVSLEDLTAELLTGLRERATEAWEKGTKPEFRNRVKLTMQFDPLTKDQLVTLAERKLSGVLGTAAERHGLEITYDPDVLELLVSSNVDRLKGGRAVVDNIEELVDPRITAAVLGRQKGRFRLVTGDGAIALEPALQVVQPETAEVSGRDEGLSLAG
jgi:ATP-dependent Clp protease ATP-binding subunit ClpA